VTVQMIVSLVLLQKQLRVRLRPLEQIPLQAQVSAPSAT
jgi:hypothetical protein